MEKLKHRLTDVYLTYGEAYGIVVGAFGFLFAMVFTSALFPGSVLAILTALPIGLAFGVITKKVTDWYRRRERDRSES